MHHIGVKSTLAELHSKFWVPKGRQTVKKVIGKCQVCKRMEAKVISSPLMAQLAEFRGVDFAGPLFVKEKDGGLSKAYIALFTCCVTRGLHLDLVEDLSASVFRRCLRRFAARRGTPELMVSDNAKTFKATERAMRKLYNDPEVRTEVNSR